MLSYWLLGLLPIAAVGYLIWAHRKRSAQRAAASEERLTTLYQASKQPAAGSQPAAAPAVALPAAARAVPVDDAPLPYRGKARILTQPQAVLYYLLKSAFPDHEIFVHVSLAGMIEVAPEASGAERDERRRAISQLTVDCAVCSKAMALVAAIDLVPAGTADSTFKSRCLKAAGVHYVQVDPARLPRRENVRALVLGTAA